MTSVDYLQRSRNRSISAFASSMFLISLFRCTCDFFFDTNIFGFSVFLPSCCFGFVMNGLEPLLIGGGECERDRIDGGEPAGRDMVAESFVALDVAVVVVLVVVVDVVVTAGVALWVTFREFSSDLSFWFSAWRSLMRTFNFTSCADFSCSSFCVKSIFVSPSLFPSRNSTFAFSSLDILARASYPLVTSRVIVKSIPRA